MCLSCELLYLISIKIIQWVLINSLSLFPLGICYTSYFYKCVRACTVGLFNIYRAESGNWWIAKSFVKGDDFLFSFKISVTGCYDGKCLGLSLLNGTDWHKVFFLRSFIFKMWSTLFGAVTTTKNQPWNISRTFSIYYLF